MKHLLKHLPNTLTCCNLLCGCVGVVYALKGCTSLALGIMLCAALFDFLDGFSARLLGATSAIGKELDSLADVVSFGVSPAAMLHTTATTGGAPGLMSFFPFLLVAFSALRLAKFNIDDRQSFSFIGLPTTASALFIAFLLNASHHAAWITSALRPVWVIPLITLCLSWLLVSEIPFFSLKIKKTSWKENKTRILFLAGCVLLTIIGLLLHWHWTAIMLAALTLYMLLGVFLHMVRA